MERINKDLIAPCGMNCGLCLHYLRAENRCTACFSGRKINGRCIKCGIKLCKDRSGEYCFDCDKFPCERLKRLDKRYREKYGMSEIENLEFIHDQGIDNFIENQRKKYQSSKGIFCVHDGKVY